MNKNPLISICIPAYNAQGILDKCLRSIAMQDFSDYEVVIVDDGTQIPYKPSEQILAALDGCKLKLMRQQNAGTYAARQRAIEGASGRYIFCVDADDCLPGASVLRKIAAAVERNSYPDVLLFNASLEDGTPCVTYAGLNPDGVVPREEVVKSFMLEPGWNAMWCMVFQRHLFRVASFRPRLLMAEDRLQKAEIFAQASSFALFDEPLYLYREVQGSKMRSPFETADFYDRVYVNNQIRDMLVELGVSFDVWALSSKSYIMTSLFELANDKRRNRRERTLLYSTFRETDGLEEILRVPNNGMAMKDSLCMNAFTLRRWTWLDSLLIGRRFISKIKSIAG